MNDTRGFEFIYSGQLYHKKEGLLAKKCAVWAVVQKFVQILRKKRGIKIPHFFSNKLLS